MTATLSTEARPAYDGPRTRFTREDGRYSFHLTVPAYRVRREDKAACMVANEEVARGLAGVEYGRVSSTGGYVGNLGTGYSAVFVEVTISAESDDDALRKILPAVVSVGAIGTRGFYMEPTEHGATGVMFHDTPAPKRIENLPDELRTV